MDNTTGLPYGTVVAVTGAAAGIGIARVAARMGEVAWEEAEARAGFTTGKTVMVEGAQPG